MARILFLTQVLPYPLNAGPKVRAYHMLRHLAGQHEVTLVSFVRPDDSADAIAHLSGICRAVHTVSMQRSTWRNLKAGGKGLLTGLPIVMARDEIEEMQALVRRLASEQDLRCSPRRSTFDVRVRPARGTRRRPPRAAG